jgi:hypothetical protein
MTKEDELTAGLRAELARVNARLAQQEGRDWSLLEATQESLREHMAEIKRLKAAQPAPVDAEGENKAVRSFLMLYGQPSLTVGQMKKHMAMCGFKSWPAWVETEPDGAHLTKAGAQLWIRHLFALEPTPPTPQPVPVKTFHGGKAWPVAPSNLNPEHIIRQLVTALEGSGTRLRTDQWYVEIEAVAAGKRYLNEMALLGREKMDEEHRVGFDGPPED